MASLQSTDDLMKEVELPFDRGDWIGRNALGKNESGTTEPVKLPLNQKYHNAANTVFERLVLPSRNKSLRDDIANNVKIQAHGIDYVRSIDCGSELSHFAVSPTYAHSALYTTNKIMDATKETAEIKELLLPDNSPLTTDFISGRIFGDALDECPVGFIRKIDRSSFHREGQKLDTGHVNQILRNIITKKDRHCLCLRFLKRPTEKPKGGIFADQVNSVIKDLATCSLTKEVNANTIKKKPTQTHLTQV